MTLRTQSVTLQEPPSFMSRDAQSECDTHRARLAQGAQEESQPEHSPACDTDAYTSITHARNVRAPSTASPSRALQRTRHHCLPGTVPVRGSFDPASRTHNSLLGRAQQHCTFHSPLHLKRSGTAYPRQGAHLHKEGFVVCVLFRAQ